jgi:pilus assembly protein CpaE
MGRNDQAAGSSNQTDHNISTEERVSGKERILLVDDDPNILQALGLTLKRFGYIVLPVQDAAEALAKLNSFKPDLIILDVMMPKMGGLELSQRLQNNPATASIPILMLSAKSREADKAAGFQAGADDYLEKPVSVQALLSRVEGVLLRARYRPRQTGSIIAVLGAKGGVGTTSLAVNLSAALAAQHKKVCLAEMREARGTLHNFLNLMTNQNMGALFSMQAGEIGAQQVSKRLVRYAPGLDVLLAPPGHFTSLLTADHVEAIMSQLVVKHDYLVLDLPTPPMPNIGPALEHAEHILLVTEPERLSQACVTATLKMLDKWGLTNQVAVVTVTRNPAAVMITRDEIQQQIGSVPIAGGIPPAAEMLQDAIRLGKSLIELKPETMPGQAYQNLAGWLLGQREGVVGSGGLT